MRLTAPTCADHGTLVLDHLRGRLDDADGIRAEALLEECPQCRAWAESMSSSPAFEAVARGVGSGLRSSRLGRRRSTRFALLGLAAAVIVTIGAVSLMRHAPSTNLPSAAAPAVDRPAQIATFTFEKPDAVKPSTDQAVAPEKAQTKQQKPLFSDGLEKGTVGAWKIHT